MKIDRASERPIYLQIYDNFVDEIENGYRVPGERLPSRRKLCSDLKIAQQTAENAYQKLVSEGYIISRPGSGYYVSAESDRDESACANGGGIYNFSANGVETSKLPFDTWSKLMRRTIKEDTGLFQYGEKAGELCLRKSIRRMLLRTQGVKCRTEQIIIGPGAEDLLRSIFVMLCNDSCAIMSNYYNYRVSDAATETRTRMRYISGGRLGIELDELRHVDKGVLYQKPTNDLPTAYTLPVEKRADIVSWAGDGRYIIEDSADCDYQYGEKKKTLWSISGGKNVIYLGSFSGTIAPSMKIGYVVVPEDIAEMWFRMKRHYTSRVSRVEQVTLSRFIDLGYYERHIAYMRSIYGEKTSALQRAIAESPLSDVSSVSGVDAGTYCNIHFELRLSEQYTMRLLREHGVKLNPLSEAVFDKKRAVIPENTYNVGYGEMPISKIRDGVEIMSSLLNKYKKNICS